MRFVKVLCCAAVLTAMTAPLATAQTTQWSKKTFLTFSGPVQVPGKTLAAGTYTFQVADLAADRHVIQILDKDGANIITTVMTVESKTTSTPEKNIVMFSERPVGASPAVKIWYYTGNQFGNEFVYPRTQAIAIAKSSHATVLASKDDSTDESAMKTADITRIDENGNEVADNGSQANSAANIVARNEPAPEPAQTSAPAASVGTSGQEATAPARRKSLPRTGSNLVFFELLSGLALAGYLGTRKVRKGLEGA